MLHARWLSIICLFAFAVGWTASSSSYGQIARYQLGKQVIAFEEVFETHCRNPAERSNALNPLQKAVQAFFALSLPEAERQIDLAQVSLNAPEKRQSIQNVISLRLRASSRWLDSSDSTISWTIEDAYERSNSLPSNLTLSLKWIPVAVGQPAVSESLWEIKGLDWKSSTRLPASGDYLIRPQLRWDENRLSLPWLMVSASDNLSKRVDAIQDWLKTNATLKERILYQSIKLNASILRALSAGRYLETDYPAQRLLEQVEAWIEQSAKDVDKLAVRKAGQYWLDLGREGRAGVVRMQLPCDVEGKEALPVLVAYHGAGGSENMFFDAYGAGRIAQLAKENGYLLIAPRQPLMGGIISLTELLDEVGNSVPIDRSRVVVIGHSMGAGQSIAQIDKCPKAAQKVVILGGGRSISTPESWKGLSVFVGAGDKDFGKGGADAFVRSLSNVEINKVVKIYDNTEHLGIVQVAWTDIFDWLIDSKK